MQSVRHWSAKDWRKVANALCTLAEVLTEENAAFEETGRETKNLQKMAAQALEVAVTMELEEKF